MSAPPPNPKAAPRKTHRKSRNGCDICKRRRVKCDEAGPPCSNCAARRTECHYSTITRNSQNSHSPAVSTESHGQLHGANQVAVPTSALNATIRRIELELLHWYSTRTHLGFAFSPKDQDLWQMFVVEEALKYDFLLKEVFALAALHKAIETPGSSSRYFKYALEAQNEALGLFREALSIVNADNCTALFIFSVMTMIYAIVPTDNAHGIEQRSALESIFVLFEFQKGTVSIVDVCRPWLEAGPFWWAFSEDHTDGPHNGADSYTVALARLQEVSDQITTIDKDRHDIFNLAIARLEPCFFGSRRKVLAWISMVGENFMNEFKEREPMALLIFLHWAVTLDTLKEFWWARTSGKKLVEDVAQILDEEVPQWADITHWAKIEVGLEGYNETSTPVKQIVSS